LGLSQPQLNPIYNSVTVFPPQQQVYVQPNTFQSSQIIPSPLYNSEAPIYRINDYGIIGGNSIKTSSTQTNAFQIQGADSYVIKFEKKNI
jgi:hypothetical protein